MQPTNYVIRYYQGDDFTLTLYPKDSVGGDIPIVPADTSFFHIADKRGTTSTVRISGTTVIEPVNGGPNAIVASLSGVVGANVKNGYVYDIGYIKNSKRVTVLTGTFSVVERVEETV
jgi:hypothetical protein